MSDPTLAQPIDVMASTVIGWLIDNAVQSGEASEMWENWPTIGEHDWERIMDRVTEMAPKVSEAEVQWAEKTLADRVKAEPR